MSIYPTQNIFVSYNMLRYRHSLHITDTVFVTAKAPVLPKMFSYCSSVHVQNRGEYQRNSFPFNLAREDIRLLGKHPSSEESDITSFPGSPPYKRNAME